MSMIFDPSSGRAQVFSHGGGTQGSAICALIVQGLLPKPDVCLIADTGREATQTWAFWNRVTRPALERAGVECHRIPHSFDGTGYNTIDIFTGRDKSTIAMPMFTAKEGQGILGKYCSNEWKRRPIERFLKRELNIREADIWIGYSVDEATTRAKFRPRAQFRDVYPLIDLGLSRADCIAAVEEMGWGKPPRSACWMCPYRNKAEWLDLKENWTSDFLAAVFLERKLREHDSDVYFHRSCVPLDQVEWGKVRDERQAPGCQSGLCFT